jgi:molybdopterin/thiamine biosynthesis adenylyltransferase
MLTKIIYNKSIEIEEESHVYKPLFFRLQHSDDRTALTSLLESRPSIKIFDTISAQLKELVKAFEPSRTLTTAEIAEKTLAHIAGTNLSEYGVWVYYPWADRLVHLLDEQEFVFLRTNRNKYKITDSEEEVLSTKKVGVIGLSVGQSVSLTMAMERTFGELRIADFDDLEITNLNRLRSGVHNMGLLKTVLVAREIAEIDPFLKVTCFHEGITDTNLESFLLDNGKLDVLIDECDGVDVKIKCRVAAKMHGIPVLMEASDRATIDIERFDLEPNRPILHGFVEHLDISNVRNLKTMEEKLPYILPIVGIETMSPRLKASAVEVGQSISTWPQLASAVTMGGGITADICRKVLLGQLHVSGRYFIDLDELIADEVAPAATTAYDIQPLTVAAMTAAAEKMTDSLPADCIADEEVLRQIIEAAVLAPSAGNNQPWKWYNAGGRLLLFTEPERSAGFANFDNMITHLSMGTAIENMSLKAKSLGYALDIQYFPLGTGMDHLPVATVCVLPAPVVQADELVKYLGSRHTNRKAGDKAPIDSEILEEMKTAALGRDIASVKMLVSAEEIARVADIAGKAEKLRMFIPQGHSDLFTREIRWDKESAEATRDGLDIRTLDLKAKDVVGFKVIKDPRAISLVSEWNLGAALENMTRDLVSSASAVCLVSGHAFNPVNCLNTGRAVERAWLVANKYDLGMQPVLASVFHFARLQYGNGYGMPDRIQQEFSRLYTEFIDLFNLSSTSEVPLFLFRLFKATEPEVKSLRLNINDIYYSKYS